MLDPDLPPVQVCLHILFSPYQPSGHVAIQYLLLGSAYDQAGHVGTHFVVELSP